MSAWMKLQLKQRQVAIAGRVIEAVTKQAIAAAEVKIEQSPREFREMLRLKALRFGDRQIGNHQIGDRQMEQFDRVRSAIDGCFYFLNLPDGSYTLSVSLPGTGTRYGRISTAPLVVSGSSQGSLQAAIVEIVLPTTALTGKIMHNQEPVSMARIQVEGSAASTFSDAKGSYLLTGLEVWQVDQQSSQPPRPVITVSARGHPPVATGVQLHQGLLTTLDFELSQPSVEPTAESIKPHERQNS